MKKSLFSVLRAGLCALVVFTFVGCAALMNASKSFNSAIESGTKRLSESAVDASGLADMQAAAAASIVYSYAFFAGGYMSGYRDFKEGEGVTWTLTVEEDGEADSVTIERALLKKAEAGKEWWFLSYRTEDEEMISEALLDKEYGIEVFRYKDPETGKIHQWESETSDTEEESPSQKAADYPNFYRGQWKDNIKGKETISVPSGKYTCDHVVIERQYESGEEGTPVTFTYQWWVNTSVPGDLVKYRWTNSEEESTFTGELVSHSKGYTSRLNSPF